MYLSLGQVGKTLHTGKSNMWMKRPECMVHEGLFCLPVYSLDHSGMFAE